MFDLISWPKTKTTYKMDPMYILASQNAIMADIKRKMTDLTIEYAKLEENQNMIKAYMSQMMATTPTFGFPYQFLQHKIEQPQPQPQQQPKAESPQPKAESPQPQPQPQRQLPPSIKNTAEKLDIIFQQAKASKADMDAISSIAASDIKEMSSAFIPISKLQQIALGHINSFEPIKTAPDAHAPAGHAPPPAPAVPAGQRDNSSPDVDHLLGKLNSPLAPSRPSSTTQPETLVQILRRVAKVDNSYKVPRLIVNGCNLPRSIWPKNKDNKDYVGFVYESEAFFARATYSYIYISFQSQT